MISRNIKRERRKKQRHYCDWPIWFAASRDERFFYGDIVDFSADSLAIICEKNADILQPGCPVKIHFAYAYVDVEKSSGHV